MTMVVEGWILASDVGRPMGRLGLTIYPEPVVGRECLEALMIVQATASQRTEYGPDIGADGENFLELTRTPKEDK